MQNSIVEKEMKKIPFLAIVLLAFAFPAHAQDAMKKTRKKIQPSNLPIRN